MILENVVFRVCLFLFRARHDDVAWPIPAKRSTTVGALGDDAMDENKCAKNMIFSSIMVYTRMISKIRKSANKMILLFK